MPRRKDNPDTSNALVAQRLENLHELVETGFAGVHARQDTTNGKVLKAAEDITNLQKQDLEMTAKFQYNRVIWYMLTVCISIIIAESYRESRRAN